MCERPAQHPDVTTHWMQRVRERIGPHVCPFETWAAIRWAIDAGRTDLVEYVGRLNRDGRRVWKFRTPDGRYWFCIVDTEKWRPITVYEDGWLLRQKGKPPRVLRGTSC